MERPPLGDGHPLSPPMSGGPSPPPPGNPFPPEALPIIIEAFEPQIYNILAAGVLMAWDIAITLDDEIELIWRDKPNLINVIYLFIRYLSLAQQCVNIAFYANISGVIVPTKENCDFWLWFSGIAGWVLYVTLDIVFIMRMFAFYGRNKYFLLFLVISFLANYAGLITLSLRVLQEDKRFPSPLPPRLHVSACPSFIVPKTLPILWIPELVFQTFLFLLLVGKFAYTHWRQPFTRSELVLVFMRDGIWAFFLIFATLVFSVIGYNYDINTGANASTWYYTVTGICGSRVVLNLRKAAKRELEPRQNDDDNAPVSDLIFGRGWDHTVKTSGTFSRSDQTTTSEWMEMSPTSSTPVEDRRLLRYP